MHGDAAVFQHVAVIGHVQGGGGELLHQQHGHALAFQARDDAEHFLDQDGRQAHRRFVEQDHFWVQHDGARHGQHLLLAARQGAGQLVAPLLQTGEQLQGLVQVALDVAFRARTRKAGKGAQQQVVRHRHRGEHAPAFGRVGQAGARDAVRVEPRDILAAQGDGAGFGFEHAGNGAHGGGLAGAVRADQGHQLALRDFKRNAVQDFDFAVGGVQILNGQHGLPLSAPRGSGCRHCRPGRLRSLSDRSGQARVRLRRSSGRNRAPSPHPTGPSPRPCGARSG